MNKSNDPRVSKPSGCFKFDMLVYASAILYDQDYGPHEVDKEKEARVFKDTIPRKRRSHRSHRSSYSPIEWMSLIDKDISKLQNPNSESEPSSSCVTQSKKKSLRVNKEKRTELQNPNSESEPSSSSSCVITQSKKSRPVINVSDEEEEERSRVFKKRKIVRRLETKPSRTTPPPEWVLNVMRGENGYNPKLITTRKLFQSDLKSDQARLSVPFLQVVNPDFVTQEETRIIDEQQMKIRKEGVSVDFFDPQMNKYVIDLRKWKMGGNWNYVFVDNWNHVLAANKFEVDQIFPLWSFRSGSGKLCFAQVPSSVTSSNDVSHDGASTSGESSHVNPLPEDSGHRASTSGECSHGCSSVEDSPPI